MNWRPASEQPDTAEPLTALFATKDADDEVAWCLLGIFCWNGSEWRNEDTWNRLPAGKHFWLPEDELLADLRAAIAPREFQAVSGASER